MIFDVCVDELLMMKISISFFLIYELMKNFVHHYGGAPEWRSLWRIFGVLVEEENFTITVERIQKGYN